MSTSLIHLDIWSDYVCPFCYLELPVVDALKSRYETQLIVTWHAFELRPEPIPTLEPDGHYLRTTWARVVYPMAEERQLPLRLPPVQPRSRKALEAVEFARRHDRFDDCHRALFQAFFEQGRDIGNVDVLLDVAAQQALDTDALATALEQGHHTQSVLADEALAHRLGITAVPTLLIRPAGQPLEQAEALSGALSLEQLIAAIDRIA
ncbi:DsbA family oxidoreductase [Pseudomonas duriflava]|nr:DsbA family protein [Pseudomonas duriflava]